VKSICRAAMARSAARASARVKPRLRAEGEGDELEPVRLQRSGEGGGATAIGADHCVGDLDTCVAPRRDGGEEIVGAPPPSLA